MNLDLFPKNNTGNFAAYFYEVYCWNLVKQTLLWHHRGYYTCYGEAIRSPYPMGQWQAVHM